MQLIDIPQLYPHAAFWTLGSFLSPSGSQKKQIPVLRVHSEAYSSALKNSTLSSSDAYWSYSLYLGPKLQYPIACTALNQQQCTIIEASALARLLSKLHLNSNTTHALIFGEHKYGSIYLLDLYIDQRHGELHLLTGHFKLEDKNRELILIDITYTELYVLYPFFHWPYPLFAKWPEWNWITLIWKYIHQLGITVDIEDQWTPKTSRHHDQSLLEIVIQLNLSHSNTQEIN